MEASEKEIRASKAARIIDEIHPYLVEMELEAFEMALAADRTSESGRAQAEDCLRLVQALRGLSSKLQHKITEGKDAARRSTQGRIVA